MELFNTTERPVAVNEDGTVLDGLTSADLNHRDPLVAALIEQGALARVDGPTRRTLPAPAADDVDLDADTQPVPKGARATDNQKGA